MFFVGGFYKLVCLHGCFKVATSPHYLITEVVMKTFGYFSHVWRNLHGFCQRLLQFFQCGWRQIGSVPPWINLLTNFLTVSKWNLSCQDARNSLYLGFQAWITGSYLLLSHEFQWNWLTSRICHIPIYLFYFDANSYFSSFLLVSFFYWFQFLNKRRKSFWFIILISSFPPKYQKAISNWICHVSRLKLKNTLTGPQLLDMHPCIPANT